MKTLKLALLSASILAAGTANAAYKIDINDKSSISFGGYIKVDGRLVSGDIAYRDFWIGTGQVLPKSQSQFKIFANETRFNTKYVHGDVTGFVEMDFLGGGGNQIISNSAHPRIRHAFIKYKDFTVGQTWSTFMNTSAIPETADFAGATVGLAFIRQGQIRYSMGGFKVALENPETFGGGNEDETMPDVVGRYDFKGDWGTVSVSALGRQLVSQTGQKHSAFGASVAGKINVSDKDDIKFQVHHGELGRYIGVAAAQDMVGEEVEEVTSYLVSYRHFWNDKVRSSVFYGNIQTEVTDVERSQWGVNVFKDLTKNLAVGFEVGQFIMDQKNTSDADSFYSQLSLRYML
ncbi:hypothetical protein D5018_16535 [Parashewanella curva]|uniref:Porin n=1 Tax=Parashewanella curva TaxID=2338552 RepID=A0A3L8PTH4_9GAMM|nr:DcaP family trimeric outer membrane transporter [Parashewanella curva]RLV58586.1 hypothetical protein D5018_16535 [Parashewanella curva]